MTRILRRSLLAVLVVLGAIEAHAQQCNVPTARVNQRHWDDSAFSITVIVPPEMLQGFTDAATAWNSACGGSSGSRNAPPFAVMSGTARPAGFNENNSILVEFMNQP